MVDSCLEILCSYGESAGVLSILSTKKLLQHQPDGTHAPPPGPRLLHLGPKNYLGEAPPLHKCALCPAGVSVSLDLTELSGVLVVARGRQAFGGEP